ncbi:MAG: tetratricopeptide repeat protein [Solirubrobacteraceae bacterium]
MNVTDQTFQTAVIERSHHVPVVVDFWAQWCAPCRQLTPVLERAVAAHAGKIELAKLDTDSNPQTARQFGIQGIPAVKAFRNGAVVSEFVGAQPQPAVERFLAGLLPSEADLLVASGDEDALRRALELEPGRADAAVLLARLLLARGQSDQARTVLEPVRGSFVADGMLARISLQSSDSPDLSDAFQALDNGQTEHGLDLLLKVLPDADGAKDEIRKVVVGALEEIGASSDLAREMRRRLASALY